MTINITDLINDMAESYLQMDSFVEEVQHDWDAGEFIHPDGDEMFSSVEEATDHMAHVKSEEKVMNMIRRGLL